MRAKHEGKVLGELDLCLLDWGIRDCVWSSPGGSEGNRLAGIASDGSINRKMAGDQ